MEFLVKAGENQYKVLKILESGVLLTNNNKMTFVPMHTFVNTYEYWFTGSMSVEIKEKKQ